jgi:hypothetical protein
MLIQAARWVILALLFYTWKVSQEAPGGLRYRSMFGSPVNHRMVLFELAYGRHTIAGTDSLWGMAFRFMQELADLPDPRT